MGNLRRHKFTKYLWRLLALVILVIVITTGIEVGFRAFLKLIKKDVITILSKEEVLEKAWFEPHPYSLYVFKPNSSFTMDSFKHGNFTINQFGFRSTLDFDVKSVQKPPNALRISTIGGSTTMGVNNDNEIWPYLMGKYLESQIHNKKIEVLNEGIMGYTSLDNLLDLAMRIVDFKCDVYVLYLGVNDLLTAAPLDIYRRDYAHFRQTLHENLSYVSFYPSWLLHLKSFRVILQASGVPDSKDLISNTATGQFRRGFQIAIEERASVNQAIRQTVIRNVTSMVGIIRAHQPEALIILSSFVDLANKQVIQDLNRDFSKLAKTHNLVFVDAANKVPRDTKIAYDYGHFTPAGDRLMGRLFAETIAECIMTTQ